MVLDDNPFAGGQIWRASTGTQKFAGKRGAVLDAFTRSEAELRAGRRVVDAVAPGMLRAVDEQNDITESYAWQRLILATGARERFLPFPGWTLPRVMGAGGLQALVKSGFPVGGKRILVAGTGPLLLAVAAYLKKRGAHIVSIAEQAPSVRLMAFAASLWNRPAKLVPAIQYRMALARVPYRMGFWPVEAREEDGALTVGLSSGKITREEQCDYLACGFHLLPNIDLAALLGCQTENGCVAVNDHLLTSVENIYCTGEAVGIAGLDAALIEGEIAGLMAAGETRRASRLLPRRNSERKFAEQLSSTFDLRSELRTLCDAETIVCRCEDVAYKQLQGRASWTEAKLQTRCGMGPCQGRVCGGAVETLFGWRADSVRPPVFPVSIESLCQAIPANGDATGINK
jgi:NADPH-dependent 2,4-dienoyl-CoA reductase/sulfur reductase-like enzyme